MLIGLKKMLRLPVVTRSGVRLGKIVDADFDAAAHAVLKYHVADGMFSGNKFLVDRAQVLDVTAEKVIVDDAVAGVRQDAESAPVSPQAVLGSVAPSTIEQE
jgi:uncharacterized protein YrrD